VLVKMESSPGYDLIVLTHLTAAIMKKHTLLLILILALLMLTLLNGAEAQSKYVVSINLNDGSRVKGTMLYASGDSIGLFEETSGNKNLKLSDINSVRIHRTGKFGASIAIGALVGILVGTAVGAATYTEPHCTPGTMCFNFGSGFSTGGGAFIGGTAGILVGAIVGSGVKEIEIDSNPNRFEFFKDKYKSSPNEEKRVVEISRRSAFQ
jgi:hypothetical protein